MNLAQAIRANNKRRIVDDPDYIYCPVPEAQSPYGKNAFHMPHRHDIGFIEDQNFCSMKQRTFDKLAEYSTTIPTGVWPGKMWKAQLNNEEGEFRWYLRWFDEVVKNSCQIHDLKIIVAEID